MKKFLSVMLLFVMFCTNGYSNLEERLEEIFKYVKEATEKSSEYIYEADARKIQRAEMLYAIEQGIDRFFYMYFFMKESTVEELLDLMDGIDDEDKTLFIEAFNYIDLYHNQLINGSITNYNKNELDVINDFPTYYNKNNDEELIKYVITSDIREELKQYYLAKYASYVVENCTSNKCSNRISSFLSKLYDFTQDIEWPAIVVNYLVSEHDAEYLLGYMDNLSKKTNSVSAHMINDLKIMSSDNTIFDLKGRDRFNFMDTDFYVVDEKKTDDYNIKLLVPNEDKKLLMTHTEIGDYEILTFVNSENYISFEDDGEYILDTYGKSNHMNLIDINGDGVDEVVIERIMTTGDNDIYIIVIENDSFVPSLLSLQNIDASKYFTVEQTENNTTIKVRDDYDNELIFVKENDYLNSYETIVMSPTVGFVVDGKVYFRIKNIANYEVTLDENFEIKLKIINPETYPFNMSTYF